MPELWFYALSRQVRSVITKLRKGILPAVLIVVVLVVLVWALGAKEVEPTQVILSPPTSNDAKVAGHGYRAPSVQQAEVVASVASGYRLDDIAVGDGQKLLEIFRAGLHSNHPVMVMRASYVEGICRAQLPDSPSAAESPLARRPPGLEGKRLLAAERAFQIMRARCSTLSVVQELEWNQLHEKVDVVMKADGSPFKAIPIPENPALDPGGFDAARTALRSLFTEDPGVALLTQGRTLVEFMEKLSRTQAGQTQQTASGAAPMAPITKEAIVLAQCELALDCGRSSVVTLAACQFGGLCADSYQDAFLGSLEETERPLVREQAAWLIEAIRTKNWAALGLGS